MPSLEDAATLRAHADGVDQIARRMETKWGYDRLPLIVSDDLREKFYRQQVKWYGALRTAWDTSSLTRAALDDAIAKCAAMKRAWAALDDAASKDCQTPTHPNVWETKLKDGTVVAIVPTNADASFILNVGRHTAVYTLDEIANLIDALPELISKAKEVWPGAKIQPPRNPIPAGGDPLPF